MALTATERKLRARLGALTLHSRYDSKKLTAPARKKFLSRFEDEVDPNRELSEVERARRADLALKAHMAKLALKSAKARRRKRETPAAPIDERMSPFSHISDRISLTNDGLCEADILSWGE